MRFVVVTPSAQYLQSAGTRIRYQRIREPLARRGCTLSVETIGNLDAGTDPGPNDVFLFSKVQDARAVALAYELRSRGGTVGVDLFDDYFSQVNDARFAPQRCWLTSMAKAVNFYLCSTERMREVAQAYFGGTPGHVLNDPFDRFDWNWLISRLEAKRQHALRSRRINVLWFGMGDNPNFPVGLHDLTHFGRCLTDFTARGFEIRLKILTNLRALDGSGLRSLRRLPVQPQIEEWTQDRERELLDESLVSFLPVNGQGFSIAKSLNRAVTALAGGTQILSAGYPLYAPLDDFLYRDPCRLVDDLISGRLAVSQAKGGGLGKLLEQISDPISEAQKLCAFLDRARLRPAGDDPVETARLAILHGERSTGAIHKFAKDRRWLSLGSPFTPAGLSYDAHLSVFDPDARPAVRVSAAMAEHLAPRFKGALRSVANGGKGLSIELRPADLGFEVDVLRACVASTPSGARIAMNQRVLELTRRIYTELFGPLNFIVSELNPLLCQAREIEHHAHRIC